MYQSYYFSIYGMVLIKGDEGTGTYLLFDIKNQNTQRIGSGRGHNSFNLLIRKKINISLQSVTSFVLNKARTSYFQQMTLPNRRYKLLLLREQKVISPINRSLFYAHVLCIRIITKTFPGHTPFNYKGQIIDKMLLDGNWLLIRMYRLRLYTVASSMNYIGDVDTR